MTFLLNQYNKKSFRSSAEKQRDERIYFRGTTQLGKCPTQFPVTVKSVCLYTYGSKQRLPGPFIQTAIPDFHLRRLPWMASIRTTLPVLWLCICMSRVYHPRMMVSTGIEKVLRIDRPDGRRVHREKVDGPPGRRVVVAAFGHTFGVRVQRVQKVQRVVMAADAADFKECDPLHYFTSPPSFRGAQVIEAPPPPALDNFQLSCYHLLKIRSLGLHTVELRFLSIRNISRSALFSVGRLFLQGSLLLCIFWRFV